MEEENLAKGIAAAAPDKYEERDGQLYLKFDRVCIFWYEPLKSMVAQYQLNNEVAHNVMITGAPRMLGEITVGPVVGLLPLALEAEPAVVLEPIKPLLDDASPSSTEPRH